MKIKIYKIIILLFRILKRTDKVIEYQIKLGKLQGVKIGTNFRCFSNFITPEPYLIEIGNNVTISTGVNFVTHDNSVIKIVEDGTDSVGKIIIGDNCFIGLNSIILPGIELGENTIVGAGSVVTKSFKEGKLIVAGNPAKKICNVDEYKEKIEKRYFDFRGKNNLEKKIEILNNLEKTLKK